MPRFQYLPRFPQNVSNFWYSNLPFYEWTHRWAWQSPPSPIRGMEQIHEIFPYHSVYFPFNIFAANRCPMIAQKMREKYIRAFLSVEFNRVHLISLSKWYKKFIVPTLSAPTIHPGAIPCQLTLYLKALVFFFRPPTWCDLRQMYIPYIHRLPVIWE